MVSLNITPQEVESGILSPDHRESAVRAIRHDGFVVLNDVIDREHLAFLREKMLEDVREILAREDTPFNFNTSNLQQDPPPFPPYLFRDILLNDMVIAVTKAVLGPGVKNSYYSGNTAMTSTLRQPVHPDVGQLWPNLEAATPTFGLVVNVPMVDMSPENGSTELWPGSHLDTSMPVGRDIKVPEELLEERRKIMPPFQPSVRAGSVLIRDIRLWHAGMPNRTATPRPMIAMIHWIGWWSDGEKLKFPRGTEEFFRHPDLHTNATFVDGLIDYIHHPHAYDFEKENSDEEPKAETASMRG
ncbi:MAG: phytanoyl-CoA dioxygenase family protein [Armatimonadetes bacterium]|nr:phytanoyl-CoA dioxygenase family protein [Armatimonadota bacterium]